MITVIAGTNRPDSNSAIVCNAYITLLESMSQPCQQLHLSNLPQNFIFSDMFGERTESMTRIIDQFMVGCDKLIFVVPEYNGGFPGILKAFIDACPSNVFYGKKAGLIGLSAGRSGSLRAMDQLTNVLNHLQVNVYFAKPKLSGIDDLVKSEELVDTESLDILKKHASGFIEF